jgi:hypothetical protein
MRAAILCGSLLILVICLGPAPGLAQPPQSGAIGKGSHPDIPSAIDDIPTTRGEGPVPLNPKLTKSIVESNFAKSKKDATELAALAKQLREELDKPDADPLSAEITTRIEKIQKLAKKIRDEMKGY